MWRTSWLVESTASAAAAYGRLLEKRPRLTSGANGAALAVAGDYLAQRHVEPDAMPDLLRAAGAASLGAFFGAIVYPSFYAWLDQQWPGRAARAVVSKSLADVALLGTTGNALSIFTRCCFAGQTATTASSAVMEKLPRVMLADFCSWMPYNMLAFRFVPLHLRPTTTALMTTCWQTYLSWESHRRRAT